MCKCIINMPDKDDWDNVTVCVKDGGNVTQMYQMNQRQMIGLFSQLVTAYDYAQRKGKSPIKITFNDKSSTYEYRVWSTIFRSMHWWFDQYIDDGPAVEYFNDDANIAEIDDIEGIGC